METETSNHSFRQPHDDVPEVCTCGAAYVDGYHLHVMKVAHLRAHGAPVPSLDVAEALRTIRRAALTGQPEAVLLLDALAVGLDGIDGDDDWMLPEGTSQDDVDNLRAAAFRN